MRHEMSARRSTADGIQIYPRESGPLIPNGQYRHILLPTCLSLSERPAFKLGVQLASAHRARVTILHVLSASVESQSLHWLDAIDKLYDSMTQPTRVATAKDLEELIESSRKKVVSFLTHELNWGFQEFAQLSVECLVGEVADEIVQLADRAAVDLIVLTSKLTNGWWSHGVSDCVQRVLSTTNRQVAIVRPEARNRANQETSV